MGFQFVFKGKKIGAQRHLSPKKCPQLRRQPFVNADGESICFALGRRRKLGCASPPCRHLRGDEEQKKSIKDEEVQAQPMGILAAARVQGERLVAQANRSVAKGIYKIILNPSPAQIEERFAERTRYVYRGLFLTEMLMYTQNKLKWFGGSP